MKLTKNRFILNHWILCFFLLLGFSLSAQAAEEVKKDVDVKGLVFGHINDAYAWHITTINGNPISIPLLVIVHGQKGWDAFCASKLGKEGELHYKGYHISKDGDNSGKVVEMVNGKECRPLDISITKNVFSLLLISGILLFVFLSIAKKYKKNPLSVPTGMQAYLEPLILAIDEDVTKSCIGKNYKKFSPYILTAFFFVLITNLMGIIPIFPGGANVTGNIAITFVLATLTFLITNFSAKKSYWKDVFWPDVPIWLKVPVPIMPFIEIIGIFTKPIALMIRLFANMLSGHIMQLILVGLIFIISVKISPIAGGGVSIVSILLAVFMDLLEVLVSLIQAYVFATLSALFIGLAQEEPEPEKIK
jgi:F-type H+-transporting ATPase subunit a